MRKLIYFFLLICLQNVSLISHSLTEGSWKIQPIYDNSFLIEQAYNQEKGVIHNIFNSLYFRKPEEGLNATFTQEWPVGGELHQLSFTLPYLKSGKEHGIGALMLNYKLRVMNSNFSGVLAPRISFQLPLSSGNDALENGSYGFQFNLPYSNRLTELLLVHLNLGSTLIFNNNQTSVDYFWGIGSDFIVHKNVNFMLEYLHNFKQIDGANNQIKHEQEIIISPAVRIAINVGSLQIVPGIAVPFRYTPVNDQVTAGFIGYLSFEFPLF